MGSAAVRGGVGGQTCILKHLGVSLELFSKATGIICRILVDVFICNGMELLLKCPGSLATQLMFSRNWVFRWNYFRRPL